MEIVLDGPVLAVDIGGTKVAVGVVAPNGQVLYQRRGPSQAADEEALFALVVDLAREVLEEHGQPVAACGVGSGGPSRDNHRLLSPLNIAVWRDFPLRDRLSEALGMPVAVDNDAKAQALAEGWVGGAVGENNYLAMVVSTGIGGGIVLNGRLLDGADGNAGHIGHIFVVEGGRADAAGAVGLLEGQASGTAIADLLDGIAPADAPVEIRRRVGTLVGRGVGSVANLMDLRLAVAGGSVALGYGDDFFNAAQAEIDRICRLVHSQGARIVPSPLGADGGLIGAAAVAGRALN